MEPRHQLAPFCLHKLLSFLLISSVLAAFFLALFPCFESVCEGLSSPVCSVKVCAESPKPGKGKTSFSREATHTQTSVLQCSRTDHGQKHKRCMKAVLSAGALQLSELGQGWLWLPFFSFFFFPRCTKFCQSIFLFFPGCIFFFILPVLLGCCCNHRQCISPHLSSSKKMSFVHSRGTLEKGPAAPSLLGIHSRSSSPIHHLLGHYKRICPLKTGLFLGGKLQS